MSDQSIRSVAGGAQQPAQVAQQKPKLSEAALADLANCGINPDNISTMTLDQLLAAGVSRPTIAEIFKDPQTAAPVIQSGKKLSQDEATFENKEPSAADQDRRAKEHVRKELDQNFVNQKAEYWKAQKEYEEKLNAFNEANATFNQVSKKTIKGKKEDKEAARAEAQAKLEAAKAELAESKAKLDNAKRSLGKNLFAADRMLTEEKVKEENAQGLKNTSRKDSQLAAQTQLENLAHSEKGREAIKAEYRKFARGNENLQERLAKGSEERERVLQEIMKEYGCSRGDAKDFLRWAEKNLKQMEKEDALQEIVIGDKKAYEAAKSKYGEFDENKPQVTFMSKDTYEAARTYAASKGITLPEYREGLSLTGEKTKKVYQELMRDAAGDFGSRADLNERRDIAKTFKDVSFADTRRMFEAANVDVQKHYTIPAIGAGILASLGTGAALGIIDSTAGVVGHFAETAAGEAISAGMGAAETGSEIAGEGRRWVDGTPGSHKLNPWKTGAAGAAGALAAALVYKITNNDPQLLKKGKTLEDAVYEELGGIESIKNGKKKQRQLLATMLASDKFTPEQKLAALQEAMGEKGPKLNSRELLGANMAKALYNDIPDAPMQEVVVDNKKVKAFYVGGQLIDAATNKPIQSDKPIYRVDKDGKVLDEVLDQGKFDVAGTDVDQKVLNRNKVSHSRAEIEDVDENFNLTRTMSKNDRAQFVKGQQGHVKIEIGNGTVYEPDKITLGDDTNHEGKDNIYEYQKLTAEEIAAAKLKPENGPFYKLLKVTNADGIDITTSRGAISRMHYNVFDADNGYTYETDNKDYTTARTEIDGKAIHYHMENSDARSHGNYTGKKPNTGAQPK